MAVNPDPPQGDQIGDATDAQGPLRLLVNKLRAKWITYSTGSVNRTVFGSIVIVGTLTMGMKVVSLLKESFVASSFGTGSAFDAFTVALIVPATVVAILSGSLNAALIPTYIEVRERESREAAERLYSTIHMWNTILLVALTLIMAATVRLWLPLIASGFDPSKLALAQSLVLWSLPMVILTGFSVTWGSVLNAGEQFVMVALAPTVQPLAIILGLGLFFRPFGIYALMGGTILGVLLEAVLLGVALARQGHYLMPRWHGATAAFRKVRAQYGACIASAFMVSGMGLVDQAFASTLGPRSNSALSYGSKLVALLMSLGATAIGTAILPQLSRMMASRNWDGIRKFIRFYGAVILAVSVPATIILIAISEFLIRTMYQHGSFNSGDTSLVAKVQIFYLLRLPITTVLVLVTRTLTALRATHFLLIMSFGSFTLNAILDYLFIQKFGIAGITLSTSACGAVTLLCLSVAMYRLLDRRSAETSE
jgi:putative peptidoglycan lipid II flippase